MAERAGSYDLIADFGYESGERPDRVDMDPYWSLAIVRLGMPLSFSREKMASITKDVTQGALLRADKPLLITDDCLQLSINNSKKSHKKQLGAYLKQTEVNYLVEILPGDWCFAWLVNNRSDHEAIIQKIEAGQACNDFNSGLKFVGRVDSIRKTIDVDEESGTRIAGYNLSCIGFDELDTTFFYDNSLASKDVLERDLGQWLTRLGLDVEAIFREAGAQGVKQNNINIIIPTLLDLIVGKGPSHGGNIGVDAANGSSVSATPSLQNEAPFSYLIPTMAGAMLGKKPADASKHVLAYADILELLQGVQSYSNKNGYSVFIPDLDSDSLPPKVTTRRKTTQELLGTFLPFFPELTNRALWSVMQQYLNPAINELYTTLRVNPEGKLMPTIVLRQIPFTTEAFPQTATLAGDGEGGVTTSEKQDVAVTRFLSLPRWEIPAMLVRHLDVGRSNATRTNFVHVYGSSAYQANNAPVQYQIVNNPPIRDDLDIMRSGLKPFMTTVECFVSDQVGLVAGSWMRLVADWTIGSHLTLNGTVTTVGIQAPICEGDNTVLDGVVFHVEAVSHSASISPTGKKQWRTTLQLTNGMRVAGLGVDDENRADSGLQPIYPGFDVDDNTGFDPGLTLEQGRHTSGGQSQRTPNYDPESETKSEQAPTQLDPGVEQGQIAPTRIRQSKTRR
jgi:hypothetical protein